MKAAVVIPTLNAEKNDLWVHVLGAVSLQTIELECKIIIDSSSDDNTCAVAASHNWECRKILRSKFNHGKTRDKIVRELAEKGIDTIIFLSQDVVLASADALEELTGFLWSHPVAGCYGKQRTWQERSFNAWQRQRCYPDEPLVKNLNDIPRSGLMTVFFSNAFSAWKVQELIHYGGFPQTDFGEDMLMAAKVINQGGAVGYCPTAVSFHEHANTPLALFTRGMKVGSFHRQNPELLKQFGRKISRSSSNISWRILIPLGIKCAGYFCGRIGEKLIPWGVFLLMWLLLLPAVFLYDFPLRDVAARYAPMSEAFAAGNWQFAFHPRVSPLLPVCAGVIAFLFSCGGYLACQFAASLLLTAGIFPLYSGCKKTYGHTSAITATLLYAFCPPILRLGYYGLRETGSILGLVLLFYSTALLGEKHDRLKGFLWFAVAEFLLLTSRGDTALFALIAAVALLFWDIFIHHIPWRSFATGAILFVLLFPLLLYNNRMIGYPVLEVRHAVIWRILQKKIPMLKSLENPRPVMKLDIEGKYDGE